MKILTADHVLPISSAPINDGAVVIDGDRIVAVGESKEILGKFPSFPVENHGEAAILPGFVNCHSHLEITSMRGSLDIVEHDFSAWLLKLNEIRKDLSDDEINAAALNGALEGAAAGVTCFGDIGRFGSVGFEALKKAGLRGILFQETEFSPDNRTADEDLKKLLVKYEALQKGSTTLVTAGLSPHSPYTVGSELLQMIAQISIIHKIPLSIHVAESANEDDLLIRGEGFFTDFYENMGVEWHSPHCSPIEYLERLGVLAARPLLGHCVTVSSNDIDRIASTGSTVAHCPKSNAKFGHGYAPFEQILDRGITVGLGSDSVASNNVCDMLEESRFAALTARNRLGMSRFISAQEMLESATLGGAKALGLDAEIGTLEPGKAADLTVISLGSPAQKPVGDICSALVFSSNARDVSLTMVAGNVIYQR